MLKIHDMHDLYLFHYLRTKLRITKPQVTARDMNMLIKCRGKEY